MTTDDPVVAALRVSDPDSYYATLVLPAARRRDIQTLYAFASEVAMVRHRVTEPAAGEIRLQWWHDALTGTAHGSVRANPIADALLTVLEAHGLPAGALARLAEAHRFDLYKQAMPDVASFEGFAGETRSVLFHLSAMALNGGKDAGSADAAGHLGVADTLAGELILLGETLSRGQLRLPLEVFARHGLTENELLAGVDDARTVAACAELCTLGQDHLDKARAALGDVAPAARPAFAMMAIIENDLKRLSGRKEKVLQRPDRAPAWQRLGRLALWSLRNSA